MPGRDGPAELLPPQSRLPRHDIRRPVDSLAVFRRRHGFEDRPHVAIDVLPPDGVYATFFWVQGRRWSSVTSLGSNPTFGDGPRTLETYLFDFDGDLYDQSIRLSFVKRIRLQMKFSSPELLVSQMHEDVLLAREVLGRAEGSELAEFGA